MYCKVGRTEPIVPATIPTQRKTGGMSFGGLLPHTIRLYSPKMPNRKA